MTGGILTGGFWLGNFDRGDFDRGDFDRGDFNITPPKTHPLRQNIPVSSYNEVTTPGENLLDRSFLRFIREQIDSTRTPQGLYRVGADSCGCPRGSANPSKRKKIRCAEFLL